MDISIFEVIGPVMIGPSSSHTAGAVKLARVASFIAGQNFNHVTFGLHGSFAKTYKGHGTDLALVAGVMGLREDDERLSRAFQIAKQAGVTYEFYEVELDNIHENSAMFTFYKEDETQYEVVGSSIGGGQIIIKSINGFETEFSAQSPTLVITQNDKKGVISNISAILANNDINIGTMRVSRRGKGNVASCIIETDNIVPDAVIESLSGIKNVISIKSISIF